MTWFKVDDGLHSHKKAARAGVHAMGLWVLAGSWCADQLSDGFIPDYMAQRLDPKCAENAERLVAAGLWDESEHDGDKGWQFRGWEEHQPTREEALNAIAAKSSGGKIGNHRRWHKDGKVDPRCQYCAKPAASDRSTDQITDRTSDRSSESVANRPYRTDPYRPVPTRPVVPSEQHHLPSEGGGAAATPDAGDGRAAPRPIRIPADFSLTEERRAWARENVPAADAVAQTISFVSFWAEKANNGDRGALKTPENWELAWRKWMAKAHPADSGQRAGGGRTPHQPYRDDEAHRYDADYWSKGL